MAQVVITGAGPSGAALALLLVRRGISVTLVEAAADFQRVFRGEGLMPSGLDALEQMGLVAILEKIPHRSINAWEFILGGKQLFQVKEPIENNSPPCTLVSQPPFLEALIAEAQTYAEFELIRGIPVKDLLQINNRVVGVKLGDGREISADIVIGADGRNSIVRQRAGLHLERQPKDIDILWFKLAASSRFASDNIFYAISNGDKGFGLFHGAEEAKLHLAWTVYPDDNNNREPSEWAEVFASLSPSWIGEHICQHAETIERPIKLSVVVGRCPRWYAPGVLVIGDAAHPMSPIRAQGINVALRDVIVTANHLVPLLRTKAGHEEIDAALPKIQAEREPEIIRAQQLQTEEANQGEPLRKNLLLRWLAIQLVPVLGKKIRKSWIKRQYEMRQGVTQVRLTV
jgi:2-polyprenyl-6-methoxyphenol hydroxylase-like FAD-dependent oxidoreductase